MKEIYFNNREGQTVLSTEEKKGLRLSHITSMQELNEAEQLNINEGLIWLNSQKGEILNQNFFRKLHLKLFGKVWKWAGEYRSTEKNIGVAPWKISEDLKKFCEDTKFWIENKTYSWVEIKTHFHHRLVSIHPFPNGNGRFSRIVTNQLCVLNDEPCPNWGVNLDPVERRHIYIEALQAADMKQYDKLLEFIGKNRV